MTAEQQDSWTTIQLDKNIDGQQDDWSTILFEKATGQLDNWPIRQLDNKTYRKQGNVKRKQ